MAVLRSRSRLVTFRLDEQEFSALRDASFAASSRSMSEFAREAVLLKIAATNGKVASGLEGDLRTLTGRLLELVPLLDDTSHAVRELLGRDEQGELRAPSK